MSEQTTAQPDLRTPYQKFEDLTRRLLAVPKEEIDAEEAKEAVKQKKRTRQPRQK